MADVLIKWDQLLELREKLGNIIDHLENGRSHASELYDAIGHQFNGEGYEIPFHELQERARDVEEQWKHQRGRLADDLQGIKDHCDAIYDEFKKFDDEAAAQFEGQE